MRENQFKVELTKEQQQSVIDKYAAGVQIKELKIEFNIQFNRIVAILKEAGVYNKRRGGTAKSRLEESGYTVATLQADVRKGWNMTQLKDKYNILSKDILELTNWVSSEDRHEAKVESLREEICELFTSSRIAPTSISLKVGLYIKSVLKVLKSDPNVFFDGEVDNSALESLTELQRAEIVSLYSNKMTIYNIAKRYNIKCTDVRLVIMEAYVNLHKGDRLARLKLTDDHRIYDFIYEVWRTRRYSLSLFTNLYGLRPCDLQRTYGWCSTEQVETPPKIRKESDSKYTRIKQDVRDAIISDLIKGAKLKDIEKKFDIKGALIRRMADDYEKETGDKILHTNRKLLDRIAHVNVKTVIAEYLNGKPKSMIQRDFNISFADLNTILKDQAGEPRPKWMYMTDHIDYNEVINDRVVNKMTVESIGKKYNITVGYVKSILSHNK